VTPRRRAFAAEVHAPRRVSDVSSPEPLSEWQLSLQDGHPIRAMLTCQHQTVLLDQAGMARRYPCKANQRSHVPDHDEGTHSEWCESAALKRPGSNRRPAPARQMRNTPDRKNEAVTDVDVRDERIALGDLSGNLGYRIRRAQLWVFKDVSRRLAAFDLSPAQFSVLAVIHANPGINQLAIASALDIERAGLGRLVDRLEQQGLVTRTASAVHPRYYVLDLTAAGVKLLGRVRPVIAESEKALAEKLGLKAFQDLLQTLSIFLDD
jgi:DNA-binding MarR family transcriptional regulator